MNQKLKVIPSAGRLDRGVLGLPQDSPDRKAARPDYTRDRAPNLSALVSYTRPKHPTSSE